MDGSQFDALSRLVTTAGSRRSVMHLLQALMLGSPLAALAATTTAKGKKRRKRKKKRHEQGRTAPSCNPPCRVCQQCLNGACVNVPNRTPCGSGLQCADGQCVVGQGTCPSGADTCADGADFVACALQQQEVEENCQCLTSTEGETRCADSVAIDERAVCGQCAASRECQQLYPTISGVFCTKVSGQGNACCTPDTRGFCMAPCPAPPCTTAEQCPVDPSHPCQVATCRNGRCGKAFAPDGTPLPEDRQSAGDCQVQVCDGHGGERSQADDTDLPNDGNPCTDNVCEQGVPSHPPLSPGVECGQGRTCDGTGRCCDGNGDCLP